VHGLARAIYAVLAASCFLFAGFSLRDYVLARKGRFTDMTLRLPDPIRERIKGRIRRLTGAFAGVTFLSGAFIALLELACTGQVYLPTITFVVGVPHMRARALLYLLLYNIVFVIPLLAVLFLVVYGADPARFQNWLTRNTSKTKLVTAALFVLLGALLLTQVFAR
jgi:cytochrome c biogenesis protein CcdA